MIDALPSRGSLERAIRLAVPCDTRRLVARSQLALALAYGLRMPPSEIAHSHLAELQLACARWPAGERLCSAVAGACAPEENPWGWQRVTVHRDVAAALDRHGLAVPSDRGVLRILRILHDTFHLPGPWPELTVSRARREAAFEVLNRRGWRLQADPGDPPAFGAVYFV